MQLTFTGIIPARYNSSRFPGKPLALIAGKPMIQWTYESSSKWNKWTQIFVATDSTQIYSACVDLKIPVLMTGDHHTDCLDRAAEVVAILESKNMATDRYVVIQGDEPLFNTETLDTDLSADIVNFYTDITEESDINNPNTVKVIVSSSSQALYFSRYPIPHHDPKTMRRKDGILKFYKQLGVYSFSADSLKKYSCCEETYLEWTEGIGLNRFIELDIPIAMRYTKHNSASVDTTEDRDKVESLIKG